MGLFGRLFGNDPAKELAKARQALERDPARALNIARRLQDGELASEAQQVIEEARKQLIQKALDMAKEVEESEFYEDAVEWLDRALEQIEDPGLKAEVEAKRDELLDKAEQAAEEPWAESVENAGDGDDDHEPEFLDGGHINAFIDMMSDEVAPRFRQQPDEFRNALTDVLEDRAAEALASFDALVAAAPDDPVRRLERGRCRLLLEDAPGALEDFAAAWDGLGDVPLFAGRAESAPSLWADVQLGLGDPAPVIEKLEDIADPDRGRTDLALPYATALVSAGLHEQAEAYIRQALRRTPGVQDLSYLYAGVMVALGDSDSAIAVLETIIAPACAGGSCRPAALHMPSVRTLISLHEQAGNTARVQELSAFLGLAEGGVDTTNLQPDRSATVI